MQGKAIKYILKQDRLKRFIDLDKEGMPLSNRQLFQSPPTNKKRESCSVKMNW
jgi:hypothetical protein